MQATAGPTAGKDGHASGKADPIAQATLPPRGTKLEISLALGKVGSAGFSIGGTLSLGWRLGKLVGLELRGGGGMAEKRTGTHGPYFHGEFLVPFRFGICNQHPRVCPGLDFYVAVIPGAGYGFYDGNQAINGLIGLSLESVKTRGKLHAGVHASAFLYFDFLKDRGKRDPWLAWSMIELGIVLRWGKD